MDSDTAAGRACRQEISMAAGKSLAMTRKNVNKHKTPYNLISIITIFSISKILIFNKGLRSRHTTLF
jgi:hypothetical protein